MRRPALSSRRLLQGIHDAQSHFIVSANSRTSFEQLLSVLLDVTSSEFGFIARVLRDPNDQPFLKTEAITDISWNEETRRLHREHARDGLRFTNMNTLFGHAVLTRQAVVSNDPARDPRRSTTPDGHPPIASFLGLPILAGDELLGLAAVANRPGGYTSRIADFLAPFVAVCANVLQAVVAEEARSVAEAARRESDARLRLAGDAARMGTWEWDMVGDVVRLDAAAAALIGLAQDAAVFTRDQWTERKHVDDRELALTALDRSPNGESYYSAEHRVRHEAGGWVWLFTAGRIVTRTASGAPRRMVGVHVDITARKKAEEVGTASAVILQQIVDSLPQRVFWKDRSCRYLGANRAFRVDSGCDPLGLTDYEMPWTREQADFFRTCDQRVMESGHAELDMIEPIKTDDGSERWLSTSKLPLHDDRGRVFAVLGTYLDITALKESEAELARARDIAEAANRAKSDFLATMSHEIRTPLNGVLGYVDLVLDTPLQPDQRQLVETIKHSGAMLLQIINDILDFSKLEAGKFSLEHARYDLRDVIGDVCDLVAPQALERGVELVPDIDHDALPIMLGDATRVRQVLLNLVGNAVKFSRDATVVIVVRRDAGDLVRTSVVDRGVGIPRVKQAMVFEMFTQADSSTTRRFGGTGLGLAISRRLVEAMGGTIGLRSEPGAGSTFWFTLPCPAVTIRAAVQARATTARALVLDDGRARTKAIVGLLRVAGVESESAATIPAALDALGRASADERPLAVVLVAGESIDALGDVAACRFRKEVSAFAASVVVLARTRSLRTHYEALGFDHVLVEPVVRPSDLRPIAALLDLCIIDAEGRISGAATNVALKRPVKRKRVLLAEDNVVNQRLARAMLERAHCTVDVASNGQEAVAMAAQTEYDAIFMDCQMPVMDGYEGAGAIRSREDGTTTTRRTPIIALTANALVGDRERCLAAGMDGYVSKPFNRDVLERALDQFAA
ncbi:MAG: ATP-binding protein [Vicinamibacterales bacterium]